MVGSSHWGEREKLLKRNTLLVKDPPQYQTRPEDLTPRCLSGWTSSNRLTSRRLQLCFL